MLYIILGITGLLIIVALFTYISKRKKDEPDEIVAPPAECCGAHAVCEKGLKKADTHIDYFDDEELDAFKNMEPDAYTDEQIEMFREILYTLRMEDLGDWLISLEKREINFPTVLRPEAYDMLP